MDVFYEESSIAKNSKKGEKKYKVIHVFSCIVLFIWIVLLISTILTIPMWGNVIFLGMQTLFFFGLWYLLYRWKMNCNVSYDYVFVSGGGRIHRPCSLSGRPSSEAEQSMPRLSTPRSLPSLISQPPGSTAPGSAQGTLSPTL